MAEDVEGRYLMFDLHKLKCNLIKFLSCRNDDNQNGNKIIVESAELKIDDAKCVEKNGKKINEQGNCYW